MSPRITNADLDAIVKYVQVGNLVVPVVVATIKQLKDLLAKAGVPPEAFDEIDALCADRIALSDQEAASHGHPRVITDLGVMVADSVKSGDGV